MRDYIIVCVSTTSISDPRIPGARFFNFFDEGKPYSRALQKKTPARINHIAELKNRANRAAFEKYPNSTHVVNLESYYLAQKDSIVRLIESYDRIDDNNVILGAPVWFYERHGLIRKVRFYDTWACPEMDPSPSYLLVAPDGGYAQVSSVGSCVIYPRWIWEKYGFHNPAPFPEAGIYYNYLFEKSGLPVLIDFHVKFWRTAENSEIRDFPWPKRVLLTSRRLGRRYREILKGQ